MKVWACRDPFPKTDYRAAIGTLILNLVLEQQIAALSERGFNKETQGRFFQCWENIHSLIMEAETQSSGYMGDSLLPSQLFLPGSP